jgi:hypothetical protein
MRLGKGAAYRSGTRTIRCHKMSSDKIGGLDWSEGPFADAKISLPTLRTAHRHAHSKGFSPSLIHGCDLVDEAVAVRRTRKKI